MTGKLMKVAGVVGGLALVAGLAGCTVKYDDGLVETSDGRSVQKSLVEFCERNSIPLETALTYDEKFFLFDFEGQYRDLGRLYAQRVPPDSANKYGLESSWEIIDLWEEGVYPSEFDGIRQDYGVDNIDATNARQIHQLQNRYPNADPYIRAVGFMGIQFVPDVIDKGMSVESYDEYGRRFFPSQRIMLYEKGISGKEANKYDKDFSDYEVMDLIDGGISSREANPFAAMNRERGTRIDGKDIVYFHKKGITLEQVAAKADEAEFEERIRQ